MKSESKEIPHNADGTYTIEIEPQIYDKLEKLIESHRKEEEETKDWPVVHNGIEYRNMEEYRKLTGRV